MDSLPLQLQNDIIMYQRPLYPFLKEIKFLSEWFDGEDAFHEENRLRWVFDAIELRKEVDFKRLELRLEYEWRIFMNYIKI